MQKRAELGEADKNPFQESWQASARVYMQGASLDDSMLLHDHIKLHD